MGVVAGPSAGLDVVLIVAFVGMECCCGYVGLLLSLVRVLDCSCHGVVVMLECLFIVCFLLLGCGCFGVVVLLVC